MRTPRQPDPERGSSRSSSGPPSDQLAGSSGFVQLQAYSPGASPDDVPTIIKPASASKEYDIPVGLSPGQVLGHFELLEIVGSGGMASVLKARDRQLGRVVALKILPPRLALEADSIIRFKNEARAAALLDHDNIARVFFCGEDQGLHFIAFEFVEGENLRAVMERQGSISPVEAVRFMLQICAGLAHANERGVVHRDIKPSNIIITPDGKAKIVDMGLARTITQQDANGGVTHSGMTLGTFDYISPEQALDPRQADIRSDIYSLGCTIYHALTGRSPVPTGTAAKKLQAHQHEAVLDPRELNPHISDELAIVLSRMMAKSPSQRYQTPQELIAALTVLARQLNLSQETAALDPTLLPSNPSGIQLLPTPPQIPLLPVAGVILLVALLVVLFFGSTPPKTTVSMPVTPEISPATAAPQLPNPLPVPPGPSNLESGIAEARTGPQLVELLGNHSVHTIRLVSEGRYDLKTLAPQGICMSGRRLTLEGPSGNSPATVRIGLACIDPANPTAARPGSLTITRADQVRFRGIVFQIAEFDPLEDPIERPIGLYLHEVTQHEFLECRFEADKDLQSVDVAAIGLHRDSRETVGQATFRHCLFNFRRGYGVQLNGRLNVEVMECAAGPHPAVFALRQDNDGGPEPSQLNLQHATWIIDRGSVAELDDGARWNITAGYCVYSTPSQPSLPPGMMMSEQPERRAAVIRLLNDKPDGSNWHYRGRSEEPNAYHHVDAFAARLKGFSLPDAQRLYAPNYEEPTALELKLLPLTSEDFSAELSKPEPWQAFRLNANYAPLQVRRAGVGLLGARFLPSRELQRVYQAWPPPIRAESLESHVKIWWPNPPDDKRDSLPRNIFTEFEAALAALTPGDELWIRHNGILSLAPQTLSKPKLRATIKPEQGYTPVLQLAESEYAEPSLFRMVDGEELTLEGLEVRLRPRYATNTNKPHAVVTLVGGSRQVQLRRCTVTLDPQDEERLAVVALTQPAGGEMRTTLDRKPIIRLSNCFFRGKGRALVVPSARPFELEVENSVSVLQGSVLEMESNPKPVQEGQQSRVSLSHSTLALNGPLLELKPGATQNGKLGSWVPIEVEVGRNIFFAADRGIPMVRVDGGDPRETAAVLHWQGRGPNRYANFHRTAAFMEWQVISDPTTSRTWEADSWLDWTQEKETASTARVNFQSFMAARRSLTAIPSDFAVRSSMGNVAEDIGAKVQLLLVPQGER